MLPTAAFAASLLPFNQGDPHEMEAPDATGDEFVGWTIPSPCGVGILPPPSGARRLVSTPSPVKGLGSGSPCHDDVGFPEFGR
jgi:hypothetical protein